MAEPSRKNSGLEQTAKSGSGRSCLRRRSISRLVPTGTVDLVAITVKPSRWGASSPIVLNTKERSAWPSPATHRRADGKEYEIGLAHRRREPDSEKQAA